MVHADPAAAGAAVVRLVDLALAWESPGGLRPLSGVAEALRGDESAGVSGLRPMSPDPADPDTVAARIAALSPAARALLAHVDDHGGEGTTGSARRTVSPADAATPVEELIAHRLLLPRDGGTLVLPGEVGLALRGGRTTRTPRDEVPEVATTDRDVALVERSAAGAAFEAVRRVELVLDHWGLEPPGVLRGGGLAVRDLKATARDLQVDEPEAGLLVELASVAGLLTEGADEDGDAVWLPTDAFDAWSAGSVAERWATLVLAWLDTTRVPSLIGTRDPAGRTWNALAPDLSSQMAPEARRLALEELAALPAGAALATGTGVPSLVSRVAWRRPRRPSVHARPGRRGGRRGRGARPHRRRRAVGGRAGRARRRPRRRGRGRSRRTCRTRSTTCCSRPTSPRWPPARSRPSWPAPCTSSPTSSPAAAPPSTASPRARCAAPSTPAGRPWRCTTSSARCRAPRSRSR